MISVNAFNLLAIIDTILCLAGICVGIRVGWIVGQRYERETHSTRNICYERSSEGINEQCDRGNATRFGIDGKGAYLSDTAKIACIESSARHSNNVGA